VPDVKPSRKITRQHPPLTAGSDPIEDGIQDFTDIGRAFLATPGLLCNMRCNQVKLLVIQIAWVAFGRVWCGSLGVVVVGHRWFLRSMFRTVQNRRPRHGPHPIELHPKAKNTFYSE